jgi:hypothetical protein
MITKSELQVVYQQMRAEHRADGEPPTAEEVLAYFDGKLSDADEARVRELLVAYPEMARAATAPFPSDDARPGDPGFLSEAELSKRWESLQGRIHQPRGARVLQFWQAVAAIAAALAITFGSLLWRSQVNAQRLTAEVTQPHVIPDEIVLVPDGRRGPGDAATTVTPVGDSYLLVASVLNPEHYDKYRLEIAGVTPNGMRTVWRSAALTRRPDDTFLIGVPRAFLPPGLYRIVVYGTNGGPEEQIASYSLRVASH